MLLKTIVHAADVQDPTGARLLLAECLGRFPRLKVIYGDAGYRGKALNAFALAVTGARIEAVEYPLSGSRYRRPRGEIPQSKRWVVERTFAWEGRNRRLSKDYEERPESEEAWLYLGLFKLMLRRLAI